jgi:hypothetical protein
MMMDVQNDLQARCMTAWGTRCVDNLEVDGPLTRRGARTPELQPTEPTPCEIEATEPTPCEIVGAHAGFLELDSDPGTLWLVATSTPQERDNMSSGRLTLGLPVQTISKFLIPFLMKLKFRISQKIKVKNLK